MEFESAGYFLEQIGVILLSTSFLYLLYQWIEKSMVSERDMEGVLQKAKGIRQEAMERSIEILFGGER